MFDETGRREIIILITPTIVRNLQEARDLTDECSRKFRAMEPLYEEKADWNANKKRRFAQAIGSKVVPGDEGMPKRARMGRIVRRSLR